MTLLRMPDEEDTLRRPNAGEQIIVILGPSGGSRVYDIDESLGKWNNGWIVMANRRRRYFVTFDRPGLDGQPNWIGWSVL